MSDEKSKVVVEQELDSKAKAEAKTKDKDVKAPVSEICGNATENAVANVDDDSEIKPVDGFFLTSQRWH